MLYLVGPAQEALYRVIHGSVVFLHAPSIGSRTHISMCCVCILKNTTNGVDSLGSLSHCSVTLWFTATLLDGLTVNLSAAEK